MPGLVYVSQGSLHHVGADGHRRRFESQFARSLRDRAAQIENRHAWKSQGRGARFLSGMMWAGAGPGEGAHEVPVRITGLTRGWDEGGFLYALETNEVAGLFAVDSSGAEQRIFHTADFRLRHLTLNPEGGEVAATVVHSQDQVSHIGLVGRHGGGVTEITEGDSVDCAPRWSARAPRQLLYQSAGVGRDAQGRAAALAPFALQRIDLDRGVIQTVAEDARRDLLMPLERADGALFFIRKPHAPLQTGANAWAALKDTVLLPFRLSFAVFQFFNFFSMRYGGKPLANPKGGLARPVDPMHLLLAGNLAAAMEMGGVSPGEALAPGDWELVRRATDGREQVAARGVLAFDVGADGALVYTDGAAVFRVAADGAPPERLAEGSFIDQVAAMG